MELISITIVRLFAPLLILKLPILGIILSQYFDLIDWQILNGSKTISIEDYQIWDKLLDTYFLTFVLYLTFGWKDKLAKKIAFFSFFWRLTGVIFLFFLKNSFWLFVFPNFFFIFFLFYQIYIKITGKMKLLSTKIDTLIIVLSILIPNLIAEYLLHVVHRLPLFSSNSTLNFYSLLTLYFLLPLLVLIIKLIKNKS